MKKFFASGYLFFLIPVSGMQSLMNDNDRSYFDRCQYPMLPSQDMAVENLKKKLSKNPDDQKSLDALTAIAFKNNDINIPALGGFIHNAFAKKDFDKAFELTQQGIAHGDDPYLQLTLAGFYANRELVPSLKDVNSFECDKKIKKLLKNASRPCSLIFSWNPHIVKGISHPSHSFKTHHKNFSLPIAQQQAELFEEILDEDPLRKRQLSFEEIVEIIPNAVQEVEEELKRMHSIKIPCDKESACFLIRKYACGDQEKGITRDPHKALEYGRLLFGSSKQPDLDYVKASGVYEEIEKLTTHENVKLKSKAGILLHRLDDGYVKRIMHLENNIQMANLLVDNLGQLSHKEKFSLIQKIFTGLKEAPLVNNQSRDLFLKIMNHNDFIEFVHYIIKYNEYELTHTISDLISDVKKRIEKNIVIPYDDWLRIGDFNYKLLKVASKKSLLAEWKLEMHEPSLRASTLLALINKTEQTAFDPQLAASINETLELKMKLCEEEAHKENPEIYPLHDRLAKLHLNGFNGYLKSDENKAFYHALKSEHMSFDFFPADQYEFQFQDPHICLQIAQYLARNRNSVAKKYEELHKASLTYFQKAALDEKFFPQVIKAYLEDDALCAYAPQAVRNYLHPRVGKVLSDEEKKILNEIAGLCAQRADAGHNAFALLTHDIAQNFSSMLDGQKNIDSFSYFKKAEQDGDIDALVRRMAFYSTKTTFTNQEECVDAARYWFLVHKNKDRFANSAYTQELAHKGMIYLIQKWKEQDIPPTDPSFHYYAMMVLADSDWQTALAQFHQAEEIVSDRMKSSSPGNAKKIIEETGALKFLENLDAGWAYYARALMSHLREQKEKDTPANIMQKIIRIKELMSQAEAKGFSDFSLIEKGQLDFSLAAQYEILADQQMRIEDKNEMNEKAFNLFRVSAEAKYPLALATWAEFCIGSNLSEEKGQAILERAINSYIEGADLKEDYALQSLKNISKKGIELLSGCEGTITFALLKKINECIQRNDPSYVRVIHSDDDGFAYLYQDDYQAAYDNFKKRLEHGTDVVACIGMGKMYEEGLYVAQSIPTSIEYYKKALWACDPPNQQLRKLNLAYEGLRNLAGNNIEANLTRLHFMLVYALYKPMVDKGKAISGLFDKILDLMYESTDKDERNLLFTKRVAPELFNLSISNPDLLCAVSAGYTKYLLRCGPNQEHASEICYPIGYVRHMFSEAIYQKICLKKIIHEFDQNSLKKLIAVCQEALKQNIRDPYVSILGLLHCLGSLEFEENPNKNRVYDPSGYAWAEPAKAIEYLNEAYTKYDDFKAGLALAELLVCGHEFNKRIPNQTNVGKKILENLCEKGDVPSLKSYGAWLTLKKDNLKAGEKYLRRAFEIDPTNGEVALILLTSYVMGNFNEHKMAFLENLLPVAKKFDAQKVLLFQLYFSVLRKLSDSQSCIKIFDELYDGYHQKLYQYDKQVMDGLNDKKFIEHLVDWYEKLQKIPTIDKESLGRVAQFIGWWGLKTREFVKKEKKSTQPYLKEATQLLEKSYDAYGLLGKTYLYGSENMTEKNRMNIKNCILKGFANAKKMNIPLKECKHLNSLIRKFRIALAQYMVAVSNLGLKKGTNVTVSPFENDLKFVQRIQETYN